MTKTRDYMEVLKSKLEADPQLAEEVAAEASIAQADMLSSQSTLPLLSDIGAGRLLNMSSKRVRKLARAGLIPKIVLPNGEFRFDANDLQEWIATLKVPAVEREDLP